MLVTIERLEEGITKYETHLAARQDELDLLKSLGIDTAKEEADWVYLLHELEAAYQWRQVLEEVNILVIA